MTKKKSAGPKKHTRNGQDVTDPKPRPTIGKGRLNELLDAARTAKQDTRSLAGTLGQQIKDAVENEHLNRRAFNITKGLDALESEALADALYFLDLYLVQRGLRARAAKVLRMDFGDEERRGEPEAADKKADNVVPMPAPAGA